MWSNNPPQNLSLQQSSQGLKQFRTLRNGPCEVALARSRLRGRFARRLDASSQAMCSARSLTSGARCRLARITPASHASRLTTTCPMAFWTSRSLGAQNCTAPWQAFTNQTDAHNSCSSLLSATRCSTTKPRPTTHSHTASAPAGKRQPRPTAPICSRSSPSACWTAPAPHLSSPRPQLSRA